MKKLYKSLIAVLLIGGSVLSTQQTHAISQNQKTILYAASSLVLASVPALNLHLKYNATKNPFLFILAMSIPKFSLYIKCVYYAAIPAALGSAYCGYKAVKTYFSTDDNETKEDK
jgi:hypothetical protein